MGRRKVGAAIAMVLMVFTLGTVAKADNIQNDVVAGDNDTVAQGESTIINYKVTATNSGGGAFCNASDGTPVTVTINGLPAGVTYSPNPLVISSCHNDGGSITPVTFTAASSTVAGVYPITASYSDAGIGTYNTSPASFSLTVEASAAPADTTPPDIVCGTADGLWHATDVGITCTASDSGSGLANPSDASFTLATSVPAGTEDANASTGTHQVCDIAGNCATAGPISGNMVDKKGPTVTCDTAPTFILGQAGAVVTASVTDGGSGAASTSASAPADTSSIGAKSADVTGTDNVGNTTTVGCAYSVIFNFTGFFSPVDNLPTLNVVQAGRAIPIKFSLAGDQGLGILATGSPTSKVSSCAAAGAPDTIEETVTAGGSSLSYDATADQYNYVWKTEKSWAGTCRTLTVKLIDGTVHQALFSLKK